ncbi:hypothetical protein PENTCL1PPCAC_30043, partial [Pristionchus entomophagus]
RLSRTEEMSKYRYVHTIEPKCCCCKVSSFLKCTYISIIVLSLCTLAWAGIAFFFHSSDSSTTFEKLLYKAYYHNNAPYLPMIMRGESDLKLFDLFTSISGIIGGFTILITLLKPNNCTLVFSRVYMLVPMCLMTIQNFHFISGAYGVALKDNEQLALVIVMVFFTLFVINFFAVLNLLFSFFLLCRLPTSNVFTRIK